MKIRAIPTLALLAVLVNAAVALADEIRLKDGTKISGTIVGFENGAFRVETSYGFALIQKDKVADINITVAKKEPEAKAKPTAPSPAPAPTPVATPAVAKQPASAPNAPAAMNAISTERPAAPAKTEPAPAKVVVTAPTPPPPPVPPALPAIRDEVRGNLYVNHTYGFQMYKPPSWDMIPEARKALPDAVAALGTFDQTTMLVIGRERVKDSLDAHATGTSNALGGVYENYRVISTRHLTIAGLPAIEQRSRGMADGRDWSVTLLTFLHGEDAFTLLGMTWADSDLIQVQENVISKTVNSLTFQ